MPIPLDMPSIGDLITISSAVFRDHVDCTFNLDLYQHRLSLEESRGAYWYRFDRTYSAPGAAIVGTVPPRVTTRWETAALNEGTRGPVSQKVDHLPFAILSVGRQNWKCSIPMPDGGSVGFTLVEDLQLRISASIPAPSSYLSYMGGYCRLFVRHPSSQPALSPCTSLPDLSGQNAMAKSGLGLPVDGPFFLKPAVKKPGTFFTAGSWQIFRPSRVNWEYWNAVAGFGPVIKAEAYCSAPAVTK